MKLQICRPSFFDARDAIIQADQVLTGGENFCLLWEGFASRGLGQDATVRDRTPWGGGVRTNVSPPISSSSFYEFLTVSFTLGIYYSSRLQGSQGSLRNTKTRSYPLLSFSLSVSFTGLFIFRIGFPCFPSPPRR
jgi:hypothetical protein